MLKPIATWNTARAVWETNQTNLNCEHWEPFLAVYPKQGITLNGQLYELPTLELLTAEKESSLLPTPNTMDSLKPRTGEALEYVLHRGDLSSSRRASTGNLREDVMLLPTPLSNCYKGASRAEVRADNPKSRYNVAIEIINNNQNWGRFAEAIQRWETIMGRPAPAPTNPDGKDNSRRLSSRFTEFLMGLPDGWVTGVGIPRVQELKALGNGVVPQQAEQAIRLLLGVTNG